MGIFKKIKVVSVCFGLLRNRSVCFGCFDKGSKHRNKQNFFLFGFTKQTETNAKQILFRFVSVRTDIYFCLFRGHPSSAFCTYISVGPLMGLIRLPSFHLAACSAYFAHTACTTQLQCNPKSPQFVVKSV